MRQGDREKTENEGEKRVRKRAKNERMIVFDEEIGKQTKNSYKLFNCENGSKQQIYFPYQPYKEQIHLIQQLRTGVRDSRNILVESPTGTGKTLCTLAGVLSALAIPKQLAHSQGRNKCSHKIFYLTRTHSQITQVMNELKRMPWYKLKANIIASRDQLCINKNLSQLKGKQLEKGCQDMCRQKLCKFKEDMNDKNTNKLMRELMSIDEMKQKCYKNFCCPFYLSKSSIDQSELTIMPFNYLLDWNMFEKNNFSLKNSVIIFDEAHNVDSLAEEGSSLVISTQHLYQSLTEIKNLRQALKCRYLHRQFNKGQDEQAGGYIGQIFNLVSTANNKLKSHSGKEVVFTNLHDVAQSLKQMTSFIDPQTHQAYEGINLGNYEQILYSFQRILKVFSSKAICADYTNILWETLKKMFNLLQNTPNVMEQDYYVSISSNGNQEVCYKFNCLNASFCFQRLQKQRPKSIILCSGTLGSFDLLQSQLGIKFPIQIRIPSYIRNDQVCAHILSKFTNNAKNQDYDFSYNKKSRISQYEHLSQELQKLEEVVPNGIVVAFSTYEILEKTIQKCLNLKKKVFYQSKSSNSQAIFAKYSKQARENGAFLFIIMKGRFAEGINFSDELCRCLILVGIPFLPLYDCRTMRKKQMIERRDGREKADQWYLVQTFKTVNQVIGRVIRSKKDYGVLLIVDQRYQKDQILNQMPQWVSNSIKDSNLSMIQKIEHFFKTQKWAKIQEKTQSDNYLSKTTLIDKKSQFSSLLQKDTPIKKNKKKGKKKQEEKGEEKGEKKGEEKGEEKGEKNEKKEKKKNRKLKIIQSSSSSQRQIQNKNNEYLGQEKDQTFSKFTNEIQSKYKVEYPWLSIDYFLNQNAFEYQQIITNQDEKAQKMNDTIEGSKDKNQNQSMHDKFEEITQIEVSYNRRKKKPTYYQ